jgi:DNA primase
MDVITSHQYGWENTVATMGTALTEKHIAIIKKYTRNLVLALDSDPAGIEASLRIAESIDIENYLNSDVRVVLTPQGKDPDEVIKLDSGVWKEALDNAELLIDYAVKIIKKKYDLSSPNGKSQAIDKFLPVISKVKDPARWGEYLKRFAEAIQVNEQEIMSIMRMSKKVSSSKMQHALESWKEYIVSPSFGKLEDQILGLILQYPDLKTEAESIQVDYFQKRESLEIFTKWLQYGDADAIRMHLDPILQPYLDHLLQMQYPPLGSSERIKRVYYSYANRLQERYHKNMLFREAALLDAQGEEVDRITGGITHAKSLKEIYEERTKRR